MYEDGALEEYITYLEDNLPTYVPKLLDSGFTEGIFDYYYNLAINQYPLLETKDYLELRTGTIISGQIRDFFTKEITEEVYDFYEVEITYRWWQTGKIKRGDNVYVLKSEWENPELEEVTIFEGGPGEGDLIDLVRNAIRYFLAFTLTPIYIVHSIAIILWGIIQL